MGGRVNRRKFIAASGGVAFVWPLALAAQQPERLPRIGVLNFGGEAEFGRFVNAFSRGMAERGYQDALNLRFDIRYSDLDREKLKRNAHELTAANVDLIWVPGSTPAQAAREATTKIPIVFAIAAD